ncbi:MAG TPA: TrkH family potassium uptake protein [Phycisphaerae bacterium]|nr:TrkH family potassium uptake protein [Phycisphaerae bacterium]
MRNRWQYFRPVFEYLRLLISVFGLLLLVPLAVRAVLADGGRQEVSVWVFVIPAVCSLLCGIGLKRNLKLPALDNRRAMILCALGWIAISAIGAVPLWAALPIDYLDAYFESVSGFTTTGITMLKGLDAMPLSILFWRSFIQWLGGLGILTFFLTILYTGGSAHHLFGAESHKILSRRPTPSLLRSLRILWSIYVLFTAGVMLALVLEGLSVFDAVAHAMTALATGGYSPYDASVEHFALAAHPHAVLIEYTLIVGMLLGGINFFVHHRLLHGSLRALWDSLEIRLWWAIVFGATGLVVLDHFRKFGFGEVHETFRASLFQVVAMVTTTGFGTKDIAADYFPALSKQIFLVLMVIGGCVGSTSGGIKVFRIGVLGKMVGRQVRRLIYGPSMLNPVVVDGETVGVEELRRIASLFFAWVALLALGGGVTAILSDYDALQSASGMFSALGNIGPCYIPTPQMATLHPVIKIVYILGMLAGRLEILPVLLLLHRRTWR